MLSASFIPVYARLCAEGRTEDASRVARAVGTLLALAASGLALAGVVPRDALAPAVVANVVLLAYWGIVYRSVGASSPLWAISFPLGGVMLLYIFSRALLRGSRVEWKGRRYRAA